MRPCRCLMLLRSSFLAGSVGLGLCVAATHPVGVAVAGDEKPTDKPALTFERDVLPLFRSKCFRCHAGVEPKGGLNLSQPSSLLAGGESGPAIRIAAAEFSLLYEKVASDEMPAAGPKLTAAEKGILRTWINEGAAGVDRAETVDRSDDIAGVELWSFLPPVRPKVPAVATRDRVRNPIDAFILRALEAKDLSPAPEADRLTLLRRASFDLLGLPPSQEDIGRFLGDEHPGAHGRMIDRLLASPRYGERWARHWLDVAGYADSAGVLSEDRPLPLIWKYRDYVVRAFNSDKPYDRFLQEQIAGDELTGYWTAYETQDRLPDDVVEGITATGFLRTAADASRPDFSTIKNAHAQYYYPTLFDTLQIVCSSTMGLTVQCARCHRHKFDPIPQVEYYRMQSVFMSALRPNDWVPQMKRRLFVASKSQQEAADLRNAEVGRQVKALQAELDELKQRLSETLFESRLSKLPEEIREDVKAALAIAEKERNEVQAYLVAKFGKTLKPEGEELEKVLGEQFKEYGPKLKDVKARIAEIERRRVHFDEIRAVYDLPGRATTPVLLRGDPLTPGPPVEPGVISAIRTAAPFEETPLPVGAPTSGRRLAFARWLTQPDHPLTARVMVNRIWRHHFGTGIVSTTEDFGVSGSPPSHPQLLDWLATEFVCNGWSIKQLHRLIMNSSTWRQRSRTGREQHKAGTRADPENRLLWRQNMQRLEAEPIRDAMLATSGTLSSAMYGSPHAVHRLKSGDVVVPAKSFPQRRSIYVQVLRLNPESLLQAFDQPQMSINCTQRSQSTVSTQALTLLNSDLMVQTAHAFADRVLAEQPDAPVTRAVQLAFSRPSTDVEHRLLATFLDEQTARHRDDPENKDATAADIAARAEREALADLCQMLLSANEFVYVD